MKRLIVLTGACLSLAGCVTATPEQQTALAVQAARPVTCQGAEDCEVKWSKATQWVLNHSGYKIRSQSDTMIATMGPLPSDPTAAFTITKLAQGAGLYTFDFRGGCDNIFGCIPSLVQSKASFVTEVMGDASPSPTP
jgi:hypothetical protein